MRYNTKNNKDNNHSFIKKCKLFFSLETKTAPKLLMGPAVIFLLAITIIPTIYAIYISLQSYKLSDPLNRSFVWFKNYLDLFTDARFWNSVKVTVQFIGGSLIVEMILGFILALLIIRNFKGSRFVKSFFLVPTITTPVVVGLTWIMIYDPQFGVLNYLLNNLGFNTQDWLSQADTAIWAIVVVDIWEWTPFVALVLLSGLSSLPKEPFEAAKIDGASRFQTFIYLTLPLMKGYIMIAFIFRFMDVFRWFDTIYVMTKGGPGVSSETLNMFGYITGFEKLNVSYAAAIAITMLIIMIIIAQWFIKRFFTNTGGD